MHRWIMGLALVLTGCVSPPPPGSPGASEPLTPARAAELDCIRRGREAETSVPWFGANDMRGAVLGARVRNDCLDAYRRRGILPPR